MSKKKGAKKGKGAASKAEDDEWDKLLEAEREANEKLAAVTQPPVAVAAAAAVPTPAVPATAAPTKEAEGAAGGAGEEGDGEDDDEDEGAPGTKKDNKKKKKKKAKKEKDEAAAGAGGKSSAGGGAMSAQARAILERRRALEEEEARIKKLQEEAEERIRRQEEAEEAERKRIEEEKERKRKAKQDKIEAQKAAGTYMTKAEKEKAKKAQARLEAMKAAGMLPGAIAGAGAGVNGTGSSTAANKKPPASNKKASPAPAASGEIKASVLEVVPETQNEEEKVEKEKEEEKEEEEDEWDAGGDWDDLDLDKLTAKVGELVCKASEDVEDQLEVEKRHAQQKLKQQGLERAKRDEELRLKRAEEEHEREEMERKEREALIKKETSRKNRVKRDAKAREARSPINLRSPISCILGHVDTGKTKLLDKIRHTNVQEGEAGGITQQIGATQFLQETLRLQTQSLQKSQPFDIKLPGLLVIDTPGHEAFSNLRSRGSSLCDIAILVVDITHLLEPQTIESLNLLRKKRIPFVVALNKVDRMYGWKGVPDRPIQEALAAQDENARLEFRDRTNQTILALNEQGLNAKLYWENDDLAHTVSLVPTSAHTGEGVPDLLKMLITLTQERLSEKLMFEDVLQCTVLEVKVIDGLGTTIDVVLVNGTLREGDTIVVSTLDGPVVTTIRALLTPPPNKELRIKSEYVHHSELKGAIGIKIVAPDVQRAVAGTPILVVHPEDDLEDVKDDVQQDISEVQKNLQMDNKGVMVHASTLGAMEALLTFLREECKPPIPVGHINIGPIHKKDVMRANLMNEKKMPEYASILAFDVSTDTEAAAMAEELNVRIFHAEIIYHLFDQFTAYMTNLKEQRKQEASSVVMFPCVLKILPQHIFNTKNPIVLGVEVIDGTLRLGTVLSIPQLDIVVGKVTRIENNHKEQPMAKKATSVSIRIENEGNPTLMYGRQFDATHTLYSKMSRPAIDALKEFFADEMTKADWALVVKLKKVFNIS